MRSARLPSRARADMDLLDDVLGEAEFLGIETLSQASQASVGPVVFAAAVSIRINSPRLTTLAPPALLFP